MGSATNLSVEAATGRGRGGRVCARVNRGRHGEWGLGTYRDDGEKDQREEGQAQQIARLGCSDMIPQ